MALPDTITHQDRLLSVATGLGAFVECLLHPVIKALDCDRMTYITPPMPRFAN